MYQDLIVGETDTDSPWSAVWGGSFVGHDS